jgi:hypothetical protein
MFARLVLVAHEIGMCLIVGAAASLGASVWLAAAAGVGLVLMCVAARAGTGSDSVAGGRP